MKNIEIGFEMETGKAVKISNNHLFVAGTTSSGKSETLRALINRSKSDGAKILIIDSKRPRDYDDFVSDVPLYIEKHMEPFMIKDLIESTERLSIKKELPELIRLARVSKSWEELLDLARSRYDAAKGWAKDILEILIALFERLVMEMGKYDFTKNLELPNQINVMNISHLTDQLQQIVVSSIIRAVMRRRKKIRIVIDEAHRFVPQGAAAACSRDVIRLVREGRANENFLWMADQTVTGVQKDLLKQMQIWILGRQSELNEAKRTLEQIPQRKGLGLTKEKVQMLGLGEFIVVTTRWAKITYIWPVWVERDMAIKVAKGELTAEQVSSKPEIGDDDELWKQKFEEEQKKRLDLEKELHYVKTDDLQKDVAKETITTLKDRGHELALTSVDQKKRIKELETELAKKPDFIKKESDYRETIAGFEKSQQEKDLEIKLLQGEIEIQKSGSQAFEKLRELLGAGNVQYTAKISDAIFGKVKAEIKREIIAEVGTGIITVTEDIDLGKYYQTQAYEHAVNMVERAEEEQIKILGWLMHVEKGVTRKELIKGVYHMDNLRGQASKKLTDNLDALKMLDLTKGAGGRIQSNVDALVIDTLEASNATVPEIQQILAKVKGFIAKRLRGSNVE